MPGASKGLYKINTRHKSNSWCHTINHASYGNFKRVRWLFCYVMCDGSVYVIMNNSQKNRDEMQANICILQRDFGNMTLLVFLVTQKSRRGRKILSISPLQKEVVKKDCCSHHFCQLFPRDKIKENL